MKVLDPRTPMRRVALRANILAYSQRLSFLAVVLVSLSDPCVLLAQVRSTDGSLGLWAVGPLAGNRFAAIKVAMPIHQTSSVPKEYAHRQLESVDWTICSNRYAVIWIRPNFHVMVTIDK